MRIVKNENRNELAKLTANLILDDIEELAKTKEKISIGLVGGTSVAEIYKEISNKNSG